ncbi:hypothetical protein BSKO_08536 [Bryopsis sp. KO-2023]|nr:hypothetical protein BSKO_08536 [Bryopsis sp. KO-2023]
MDRDHARSFMKRMLDEEHEFIRKLEEMRTTVEARDDWENVMKNFAPKIKGFYNTQLEAWARFYLGLDSQSYNQGHGVMHLAQKKDRGNMAATIPHSVFGELKYKMKVGTAAKLTATGATAAREIMEAKMGGEGQVIETKGKGGNIGGKDEKVFAGVAEEEKDEANNKSGPSTPDVAPPKQPEGEEGGPKYRPKPKPKAPGDTEDVPADEMLAAILKRRNRMYAEGK